MLIAILCYNISYNIAWLFKCSLLFEFGILYSLLSQQCFIKYVMHNIIVLPASCNRLYFPITVSGERETAVSKRSETDACAQSLRRHVLYVRLSKPSCSSDARAVMIMKVSSPPLLPKPATTGNSTMQEATAIAANA